MIRLELFCRFTCQEILQRVSRALTALLRTGGAMREQTAPHLNSSIDLSSQSMRAANHQVVTALFINQ